MGLMQNFIFNNKNSEDFSIIINKKSTYNAPSRVVTMQSVPGKNGDLIIDEECFTNVSIGYNITVMPTGHYEFRDLVRMIKGWLLSRAGYFRLYDSYDTDYFRLASYSGKLDIEEILPQLGECEILFNCKPFRYSFSGQQIIETDAPIKLHNKEYFSSLPYFKIYGSGDMSLYINNKAYNFTNIDGYIEIDSEIKNAFKGLAPQNSKMNGSEFPVFLPGDNHISFSGNISKIEIMARWCSL